MRLIDADKMMVEENEAYENIKPQTDEITGKINYVVHWKIQRLLEDAEEDVIRCKDCKYWWKANELCRHPNNCDDIVACMQAKADDFCSKAERRE